jgi:outer membrane protein assembly factor BamD
MKILKSAGYKPGKRVAETVLGVFSALLLLVVLQPGCAKKQELKPAVPASAQDLFDAGVKYLNEKKYGKAIDAFQRVTLEYSTTRHAADAQFFLAETYFEKKDYAQAATEYEFLTTNYATSPFFEEASYKTALSYFRKAPRSSLDLADLMHAKELLELFRERFPNSNFLPDIAVLEGEIITRFAQKEFDAGLLYLNAGEYPSARVYFEHVLEQYPKASIRDEVRFRLAMCLENTGEAAQARRIYTDLSQGGYEPRLKEKAAKRLAAMK